MSVKKLVAGKHSCVGHLASGSEADASADFLDRPAMLVYAGEFDSMDGPVEVTEEMIDRLIENHNARADKMKASAGSAEAYVRSMPPLQLDHSTSATMTVGRVIGKLSKGEYTTEDGKNVAALMGECIRILGAENTPKAKDGRWANVSIGADLEAGILNELSITPFPAAPNATLLARKRLSEKQGDTMHEKLKKHLMEKCEMSEGQAVEHMAKMKSHLMKHLGMDEEGADKHLEAMEPEHAEKMAAAMTAGEHLEAEPKTAEKLADDVKEEEKKLAAKTAMSKLTKGFSKDMKQARLAAKAAQIGSRLARLQSQAKITPAERKKLDMVKLSAMADDSLTVVLGTYENREPVIDARIHGTSKAVNLAKLQKDARLARLEAETKKDLGMAVGEKDEKALAEVPAGPVAPHVPAPDGQHEEHMKHLAALLGEHPQKDAILAHVSMMMGEGQQMSSEGADHDEKQMSGLVENVNRLQTQFEGLVKLIGEATGLSAAELAE